ncbi:DUF1772 domain-containing protein [Desulfobulbus rhabdoformis]|jgi:uncharacterized membrane protein|uniref:anthrone oxygenase family protein n=1 Tax=Desulfobulbus rhabdoformis TaxID=34032 RepID=UPI001962B0F1|nr:DUF1772 domain-containing protein [Desulfobulbus rhabdoformis]MBM9612884.1 DUF1772 domain-containing protein [Desulfobulbus rhabdoformis]
MALINYVLLVSTLLCSLVAGFVFSFASIVMPGIKPLDDRAYLQAFKAMDRVIQKNQPIFVVVWLGSVIMLILSTLLGLYQLEGTQRILLILACALYLLGVQLPTITINIPLNNQLQAQDLESMTASELLKSRDAFDSRWLLWNTNRTVCAILTTVILLVLLIRL